MGGHLFAFQTLALGLEIGGLGLLKMCAFYLVSEYWYKHWREVRNEED